MSVTYEFTIEVAEDGANRVEALLFTLKVPYQRDGTSFVFQGSEALGHDVLTIAGPSAQWSHEVVTSPLGAALAEPFPDLLSEFPRGQEAPIVRIPANELGFEHLPPVVDIGEVQILPPVQPPREPLLGIDAAPPLPQLAARSVPSPEFAQTEEPVLGYAISITRDKDHDWWIVSVPAIGCTTGGPSRDEARANAHEAISTRLEELAEERAAAEAQARWAEAEARRVQAEREAAEAEVRRANEAIAAEAQRVAEAIAAEARRVEEEARRVEAARRAAELIEEMRLEALRPPVARVWVLINGTPMVYEQIEIDNIRVKLPGAHLGTAEEIYRIKNRQYDLKDNVHHVDIVKGRRLLDCFPPPTI